MFVPRKASIALVFAIMVGTVSASPAEIDIFPNQASAEINGYAAYQVEVENTGRVQDVYDVTSTRPSEVTVAPDEIRLEPGESEEVNVWFNPENDRAEGTVDFYVSAQSRATGKEYAVQASVDVIKDYGVELSSSGEDLVCVEDENSYEIEVGNTGIQQDTFRLSTNIGSLSNNRVTVDEDESTTVTLNVDSSGPVERQIEVTAQSTSAGYASATETISYQPQTCFSSDFEASKERVEIPALSESELEYTLENTGLREDEYSLEVSNGELEDESIELDPGESEEVEVSVNPENLAAFNARLTASGRSEASAVTEVRPFNPVALNISSEAPEAVCRGEKADAEFVFENTGSMGDTFRVNVDGETREVEIGPGETFSQEVSGSREKTGSIRFQASATGTRFSDPSESLTRVVDVERCYGVKMKVVPKVASVGENLSTVYEISVTNTGTRENRYVLTHTGPDWLDIKQPELEVEPGKTEKAYMYAGVPPTVNESVKMKVVAEGEQVRDSQQVTLKVDEGLLSSVRDRGSMIQGDFASSPTRWIASLLLGVVAAVIILYRE